MALDLAELPSVSDVAQRGVDGADPLDFLSEKQAWVPITTPT